MISPAWFGEVYSLVPRPPLSHVLCPYPEGPCARDALHGHVLPLCHNRTAVTKCKFCCFFAELWLPTYWGILLVQLGRHDVLLGLGEEEDDQNKFLVFQVNLEN